MAKRSKIASRYKDVQGGLFSEVSKADVGDGFASLAKDNVTLMGWADPFYPDPSIPEHVKSSLIKAIETGFPSHYTMPIGSLELRQAISKKLQKFNGINADPSRNIIVTPGSDSGLYYALSIFVEQGDEVLVPDPSYPNNFLDVTLLGGVPISVPLDRNNGYQLDTAAFKQALTAKTKAVVLTHPNNPTTTVFRRDRLEELCQFIVENDLCLVVDQAFEDIVFDEIPFVSPATLPGMWNRTITTFSISKGMGLSGFRVGYLVAADTLMDVLYGAAVNVLGATNTLAQVGALAAFSDDSFLKTYISCFERRRHLAYDILSQIPGVKMQLPESGFYSWLDVSALGDSTKIMNRILREAKVAVNDGKNYGSYGDGYLRIIHGCLADENEAIKAIQRIADTLGKMD